MKKTCIALNEELYFFQNLNLNISTRRAVFKKFEEEMKKTNIAASNSLMQLILYGYIVSQLSDLRKFFDKDTRTHSFSFVVDHIQDQILKNGHKALFKSWKKENLQKLVNKYLLHSETEVDHTKLIIPSKILNKFIDDLNNYIEKVLVELGKNYPDDVSQMHTDAYILKEEKDVEKFFTEIKKIPTAY